MTEYNFKLCEERHENIDHQFDTLKKEINWMKKLMIGTLITGFMVLLAAVANLYLQQAILTTVNHAK
ncbi:MAG: hypothetical protein ACXABF_16220 [Candidatus Thorarchaeota archaeon]|jgi:cytidylate kinase